VNSAAMQLDRFGSTLPARSGIRAFPLAGFAVCKETRRVRRKEVRINAAAHAVGQFSQWLLARACRAMLVGETSNWAVWDRLNMEIG
jgi:hypothetical protein